MRPLNKYSLPETLQNTFGAKRKFDYHTGVDLFCNEGDEVYSIYDGVVTNVIEFTGFKESPWWNDTYAIMIYHHEIGKTFLYGEIETKLSIGALTSSGSLIGNVKRVLKNDKGTPTSMLHMECYDGLQNKAVWWYHNEEKPKNLEDITKYLRY